MKLVAEYWFTVDGKETPHKLTHLENVTSVVLALLDENGERPHVDAHTVDFHLRIPEAQ